jgi:kinesin family member 15
VVENIKVLVRVRPLTTTDENGVPLSAAAAAAALETTRTTVTTHGRTTEMFTFDVVADARVTQEEIFRTVGKDITDSCLQGYNGTIIC